MLYVALFKTHSHDPLSFAIEALTRSCHCHAAFYRPETHQVVEAYWPAVRSRPLGQGEEADIDFFKVKGLNASMEHAVWDYCDAAVAAHEPYSITGLFRFLAPARVFLGDGYAGNGKYATFCSQFTIEAIHNSTPIRLFNAPSYEVSPGVEAWSPNLEYDPHPVLDIAL